MSVPLDRLYHYLADVVNQDVLIYRWMPHGSRKLEDLQILASASYTKRHLSPYLICHDQEPLRFDTWSSEEFEQYVLTKFQTTGRKILAQDVVAKHHARFHLRCATGHTVANIYDTTLLLHSEKRSIELERYQHAGFVPVYYWSHAVISRDWFRYAEHDCQLMDRNIKKDFLIYNRAWSGTREYRLLFTQLLVEDGLLPYCKTSFSAVDGCQHYLDHKFKNSKFAITNRHLHKLVLPNEHPSFASADYVSDDYKSTGIEVVLETIFDDSRWHLTEKTLRPIACGHPFILCATPGSLQYIRDYGFETFDGLIDESYDTITDSQQRLYCIVAEMKRIHELPDSAKHNLYSALFEISQRNKARFFSKEFQNYIINELQQNFQQGMTIMEQHRTGSTIFECEELYNTIPGYDTWKTKNIVRSDSEYTHLKEYLKNVQRNIVQ